MHYLKSTWIALGVSILAAIAAITLMTYFIGGTYWGDMILGEIASPVYPFSLQNITHLLFFIGLGQLWVRWLLSYEETLFLKKAGFLPEDEVTVLDSDEAIEMIRLKVGNAARRADAFLPDLINTCVIQYKKSHSVGDTIAVLNSSLDLHIHRLEIGYSLIRYIAWAIPTFGFIGTVVGIADAMGIMDITKLTGGQAERVLLFKKITADLGFAFGTTVVALVLSAMLMFVWNMVQKIEEEALNRAGKYVLANLINRFHAGPKQENAHETSQS